jgi:hypothetical protein
VCGHLLVTVKEALAVGPNVRAVRIAAIRRSDRDAYGNLKTEALMAGTFTREMLTGVQWQTTDADRIVDLAPDLLVNYRGVNRIVTPIDLSGEPDLADLIRDLDFDD